MATASFASPQMTFDARANTSPGMTHRNLRVVADLRGQRGRSAEQHVGISFAREARHLDSKRARVGRTGEPLGRYASVLLGVDAV